jgi:hypothetical protein
MTHAKLLEVAMLEALGPDASFQDSCERSRGVPRLRTSYLPSSASDIVISKAVLQLHASTPPVFPSFTHATVSQ